MAQQADGTVYIDTLLDTTGFKAGGKDVEAAVRRMSKTVSGIGDSAKIALQKQVDSFVKSNQAYAQQERKVDSLKSKLQEMSKQKVATNEFSELGKLIDSERVKLNRLEAAQEKFLETGGKVNSSAYQKREMDIEELRNSIQNAEKEQQQLLDTGGAYKSVDTSAIEQQLADAEQRLQQMNNSLVTSFSSLTQKVRSLGGEESGVQRLKKSIIDFGNSVNNVLHPIEAVKSSFLSFAQNLKDKAAGIAAALINGIAHPFQTIKNIATPVISLMINGLNRIKSAAMSAAKSIAGKLLSGLKKAGAAMLGFHKSTKKSGGSLGSSLKTMLKYGLGIRSVFVLVNKLRRALVDGFKNLAQYDSRTNASISMLKSSLTQLKNSFATAFAPILNVIAPALNTFINMLSRAITYVGMLVAALTGQNSFVKATAVQEDYAASLKDSASATKKAEKANKTYLSGLDEIARWESNDKESDTGDSGGYAAPTPQDMFETVPIESSIKGIAEKIRSLVQSEDWEGIGSYVASGINNGMAKIKEAISWDNVGGQVTYFVNAFTTTFNSLVDNVDWNLIGSTVGEGINTIVNAVNLLITGIDWVNLGLSFASGINGLVTTVDWNNLGNMLGNYFMISWQIFYGFVAGVDWSQVGTAIANGINGVFEAVDLSLIASGIATFVNGISTSILNFALATDWTGIGTKIFNAINTFFAETDFALMAQSISEFIKGILDLAIKAVEGTDWKQVGRKIADFIANIDYGGIVSRLFEGFGAVLGGLGAFLLGLIENAWDSVVQWWKDTAFEDGHFTILGLLNGILEGLKNIGTWIWDHIFKPFADGICKAFGIGSPSKEAANWGGYIVEGLRDGITKNFPYLTGVVNSISNIFDGVKKVFKGIIDFVTGVFSGDWKKAWGGIKNIFKGIWETFEGIVKAPINGIIGFINALIKGVTDGINLVIDALNSLQIDIPDWVPVFGGQTFGFNLSTLTAPQIPYLAKGAVIPPNAPFMAVLGDQRRGNNIEAPEDLLRRIVREETGGRQSKGGTYTFVGQINRRTLFEEVIEEAKLRQTISGRNPFEMA